MASRFEIVNEKYIQELKEKSRNENTKKSTGYWKNVFKRWASERNLQPSLEDYQCNVLHQTLLQFYAKLRKENCDDYEPDCLKVMPASLERYLESKTYPKSSIQDREFLNSDRKVLDGKEILTKEVLWRNRQLKGGTPQALLSTMWWLLTQHFRLQGRQEHHQMKVQDFTLPRDDGNEFLTFAEGPTKTRQAGHRAKIRLVTLKMFATGNEERCPVMLSKRYPEKRPF